MPPDLPAPWRGFLDDLDVRLAMPVRLHCLGRFVVSICDGLPRTTADLDVLAVVPDDALREVLVLAGRSSRLHETHGVYIDVVSVATPPDGYAGRPREVESSRWTPLRLFALDPYDVALAKLERNLQRDRDDVAYLAEAVPFDLDELRRRYVDELRPYLGRPEREDLTLALWIDVINERGHATTPSRNSGREPCPSTGSPPRAVPPASTWCSLLAAGRRFRHGTVDANYTARGRRGPARGRNASPTGLD